MRFLFLAFVIMPIIEMVVLIEVGSHIGALSTIALVLLTALIGVTLLRQQGLKTLLQANQKMNAGQMPVSEMGEGLMLAVAGALLLTPGFVTDTIGFLLLTPGVRKVLIGSVVKILGRGIKTNGAYQFHYQSSEVHRRTRDGHDIIDGEFSQVDETEKVLSQEKAPEDRK